MCSMEEGSKGAKELHKLQSMLRNLEEKNDLLPDNKIQQCANDITGGCLDEDTSILNSDNLNGGEKSRERENENGISLNASLLEDDSNFGNWDWEEDISIDEEDSWLLEPPTGIPRCGNRPKYWLAENTRTPELNRNKGVLASKLDLVSIQNRKEKLNHLLAKHGLGSHSESAPGRLYPAESMCSVMSLDWEYDEDFNRGDILRQMACTDSPIRRGAHSRSLEDNEFDDLQPMSLTFETSPLKQRSVQVAPGPFITRRGVGPSGIGSALRRSSLSDKSDSSGDFSTSPRSSIGSSGNSLESSEDVSIRKPKVKGRRILLPIASLFDIPIPEEDLDISHDWTNPYASWELMRGQKPAVNRFSQNTTLPSQGRLTNEKKLPKSRAPQSTGNDPDPNLTVKLPTASTDGPVIRRRGVGNPLSLSSDSIPRAKQLSSHGGRDQIYSSKSMTSSVPRPRTAVIASKRSAPSPRGLSPRTDICQSPDIVPRMGRSPERRSRSPDLLPRKSGIVPRGKAVNRI